MTKLSFPEVSIEPVDYMSSYPATQQFSRGGDFEDTPSSVDYREMARFARESSGLMATEMMGHTVIRQIDAYSKLGESVRDELVDLLGGFAGFDVDGELTNNEVEGQLVINDADRQALNIPESFKDVPLHVVYRAVQFGYIATKTDWQITEIEIPTADELTNEDGSTRYRTLRILNLVPLTDEK